MRLLYTAEIQLEDMFVTVKELRDWILDTQWLRGLCPKRKHEIEYFMVNLDTGKQLFSLSPPLSDLAPSDH